MSEKSQTFRYSLIGFPLFVGKAVVIVSGALAIPLKTKLAIICNMNQHDPDGPNDFFLNSASIDFHIKFRSSHSSSANFI